MVKLDMEHVLILVIVVFLLYHLMNRCSCNNFSVGGQELNLDSKRRYCGRFLYNFGGFEGFRVYLRDVQEGREDNRINDRIKECIYYDKDDDLQFLGKEYARIPDYQIPQYPMFISDLQEICDKIDC
tara:strand:+ start:771 stop:1151 length:381 start_codon:yes stop_codon:yes gene_type:complete